MQPDAATNDCGCLSFTATSTDLDVKALEAIFPRLEGFTHLLHQGFLLALCHDVDREGQASARQQRLDCPVLFDCH